MTDLVRGNLQTLSAVGFFSFFFQWRQVGVRMTESCSAARKARGFWLPVYTSGCCFILFFFFATCKICSFYSWATNFLFSSSVDLKQENYRVGQLFFFCSFYVYLKKRFKSDGNTSHFLPVSWCCNSNAPPLFNNVSCRMALMVSLSSVL